MPDDETEDTMRLRIAEHARQSPANLSDKGLAPEGLLLETSTDATDMVQLDS